MRDRVWLDGELEEDTYDWSAQDRDGNVWYSGEDSKEFEDREVVSVAGSWEAGIDGATPGYLMKANPQVGDSYRQEYYAGEAEDMAEVVGLSESASVAYASYEDCLKKAQPCSATVRSSNKRAQEAEPYEQIERLKMELEWPKASCPLQLRPSAQ